MPTIDVLISGSPVWTAQGGLGFCTLALVEGERRTLVDVGHVGRRTVLLAALEQRGLTPADVDAVVMTHAHWDHAQNLDLFEHAPVLLHEWERRYARSPHANDWATPRWTGAMLETHPDLREVSDGYEIEPGVRVLHVPGHSAGSVAVLVDTDDGAAAVTGDVLHNPSVAFTRQPLLVFWNEADARASVDRILASADVFYPGHDRPFRIVGGEDVEYLEPMALELGAVDPEDPGVTWDRSPREPWVMPDISNQRIPGL